MALTETDISLILMLVLVVERLVKYMANSCEKCNKRTKSCRCKSGCFEFTQRQKSDSSLDLESTTYIARDSPHLEAQLRKLSDRLGASESQTDASPGFAEALRRLNERLDEAEKGELTE